MQQIQAPQRISQTLWIMSVFARVAVMFLLLLVGFAGSLGSSVPGAEVNVVMATIGQSVVLPCNISWDKPFDPKSIRFYWQARKESDEKGDYPEVVHVYNKGEEELDKQDASYRNRTTIYKHLLPDGLLSLLITDVKAEDDGTQFIAILPGNTLPTICMTKLRATARFQTPDVNVSCVESGGELKLLCTSRGGFPAPTVRWTGPNSINDAVTTLTTDPNSRLYSIHSTLSVNVSAMATPTTHDGSDYAARRPLLANVTFTCSVTNPVRQENVQATVIISKRCPGLFPPDSPGVWSWAVGIVVLCLAALLCAIMFLYCRPRLLKQRHGGDRVPVSDPYEEKNLPEL
ncbi:hypothetical protein AAFF_G00230500 [Aldrovandia affinis]|uniref:Ig-like domain-containing protein n=1 Tax=Aldrovandia affinis TaxID=143900 RepID=A0AAD7RFE2_9TELE|nr:hypothetical protein AAFF_G00230500 [Aldrovandia affinis]